MSDREVTRPRQTDCQVEPSYPGMNTVIFALIAPDMTCHAAMHTCPIEGPHMIHECGEWPKSKGASHAE